MRQIQDQGTNCKIDTDNIYVKNYYKKINELIYKEIVLKDKKNLLFVTSNKTMGKISKLAPNKNLDFIKSSIEEAGYTHISLDQPMIEYSNKIKKNTNYENDEHWNEIGHEVVAFEILKYLKEIDYL